MEDRNQNTMYFLALYRVLSDILSELTDKELLTTDGTTDSEPLLIARGIHKTVTGYVLKD